ncbi:hypothetical protein BCR42DRAFT_443022 [Absidia repens]|uniref:F-box domain-containing protein n=1 Tax=Absidia repens TaxID=90262 RepID=A0A1X2I0V1_9FUNG|nr:hypothetical protein BCR42DRAFT_443022 [Absidia repens]
MGMNGRTSNDIEEKVDFRIRKLVDKSDDNEEMPLSIFTDVKPNGAILIAPHPRDLPPELVSMILKETTDQPDRYSLELVNNHFNSIVNFILDDSQDLSSQRNDSSYPV